MEALKHPRQQERLAALHSYDILDTPREVDFDDIVELAAKICGTPISVVNLIDAERQWFKAEVGLGARETPLETSICSHVILDEDFTHIEDTHSDPRTADNELCIPNNGLRFYAGALIKAENGLPIGTLCVLDTKPNSLNEDQKQALKVLARRVTRELDLRRSLHAQNILRDEMDHRIKNSLSSIASAIGLYKSEARKTGEVDAAFDALRRQLDAVAAVHRSIYLSKEETGVDLKDYIPMLADNLETSLPPSVTVSANAVTCRVSPKIASTVGLIANEFAANTVKHGNITAGNSEISFDVALNGKALVLTCKNNVAEQMRVETVPGGPKPSHGIGARLIKASVAQFGGHIEQTGSAKGFELVATLFLP
ncbi:histidine kinase dimerization/phosphoacceptor domain -containing protein [Litorimonas haliclonae]|uniref:histidine kinase dimerization/phosphoacceptor domain -containing protein n=1 Tax=Litorimonas haliclonae TaxID=2081977 RepID=UPI0039F06FD4